MTAETAPDVGLADDIHLRTRCGARGEAGPIPPLPREWDTPSASGQASAVTHHSPVHRGEDRPDGSGGVLRWCRHRRRGGVAEGLGLLLHHAPVLPAVPGTRRPPTRHQSRRPIADHQRRRPRDLDELDPRPHPARAGQRSANRAPVRGRAVHATCDRGRRSRACGHRPPPAASVARSLGRDRCPARLPAADPVVHDRALRHGATWRRRREHGPRGAVRSIDGRMRAEERGPPGRRHPTGRPTCPHKAISSRVSARSG